MGGRWDRDQSQMGYMQKVHKLLVPPRRRQEAKTHVHVHPT